MLKTSFNNILFNGFDSNCSEKLPQSFQDNHNVYWITNKTRYLKNPNVRQINNLHIGPLPPKKKKSIHLQAFKQYEEEYFYLLNRLYPYLGYIPKWEKRIILNRQISYWDDVLTNNKIDLFIGSNLPHEIHDYVINRLCILRSIPTLYYYQVFQNCMVLVDKISQIKNLVKGTGSSNAKQNCEGIELFIYNLNKLTNEDYVPPFYMDPKVISREQNNRDKKKNLQKKIPLYKRLGNPINYQYTFNEHLYKRGMKVYQALLSRTYNDAALNSIPSQKYLYFPLHLQPEMTTCPQGGKFYNQLEIIKKISTLLPPNIFLAVKENPKQTWICRSYNFYKTLKQNDKVKILGTNVNSSELIKASIGVVTVTGTAGWEAIFANKPVIAFGYASFSPIEGVYRISKDLDIVEAINLLLDGTIYPGISKEMFFEQLNTISTLAVSSQYYFDNSVIKDNETNITNLLKLLESNRYSLKLDPVHNS